MQKNPSHSPRPKVLRSSPPADDHRNLSFPPNQFVGEITLRIRKLVLDMAAEDLVVSDLARRKNGLEMWKDLTPPSASSGTQRVRSPQDLDASRKGHDIHAPWWVGAMEVSSQ